MPSIPTREDFDAAREELVKKVKPKLRGHIHQWGFFVAVVLGVLLAVFADGALARTAAIIYAV
jgi:hypothetical protein